MINPDGQSDSQQGIFTIGEASPIIAGMYPVTGAVNNKVPLTISGQNFRNEVKVSFTKNSTELVCDKPLSMESSKISCNLDLATNRGASAGEWTVTVLNIRDGQKGTWVKKFVVTNVTRKDLPDPSFYSWSGGILSGHSCSPLLTIRSRTTNY